MRLVALDLLATASSWTVLQISLALFYIFVGVALGKIAYRFVLFFQQELELEKISFKVGLRAFESNREAWFIKWLFYIGSLVIGLLELGIFSIVLRWLAITFCLYLAVYILISLKDFFVNFLAGFTVRRKMPIREGEHFHVADMEGIVYKKKLSTVLVKTKSGDMFFVPMTYLLDYISKR